MRTTLSIEDDLMGLLKRRAQELGVPFKVMLNLALRRGLAEPASRDPADPVNIRVHDFGAMRPGLDGDRMNQLSDELDAEIFIKSSS